MGFNRWALVWLRDQICPLVPRRHCDLMWLPFQNKNWWSKSFIILAIKHAAESLGEVNEDVLKPALVHKYRLRQKYGQPIKTPDWCHICQVWTVQEWSLSWIVIFCLINIWLFPEALKSPVYRYLVTYTPSKAANLSILLPYSSRFSFHMMDSLAFFGGLEMALSTMTSKDKAFQQTLTKYFIEFAKEGEHH